MGSSLPETFLASFHDEESVKKMKYLPFGKTGLTVSQLSLGTGGFCLQYGDYTIEECKKTVQEALKKGINYIDTAPWYGHGVSEDVLGKCLAGIPRQTYYIATKVGRYEKDPKKMFDFSAKKVMESVETSLKKLGVDYIDVLQIHDVEFAPSKQILLEETLPAVKQLVDQGKAKFIGITGYPVSVLADLLQQSSIQIDMVLSYCRLSLLDESLKEFLPLFKSKNLGIVNAACMCMGLLSSAGPQDWHPAPQDIKDVCTEAREYCNGNGVELAKLALYHAASEVGPHTILVGMNTCKQLNFNLEVVYHGLTPKELEVYNHVKNQIMKKLKKTHWEGVELERYWEAMKS